MALSLLTTPLGNTQMARDPVHIHPWKSHHEIPVSFLFFFFPVSFLNLQIYTAYVWFLDFDIYVQRS